MSIWFLLASLALISALLTRSLIYVANKKSMIDIPNARSSHTVPTPRGGGAAIIITYFLGLITIYLTDVVSNPIFLALLTGGLAIAIVGWVDDKNHVSAKLRLVVHMLAAALALYILNDIPELPYEDQIPELHYIGIVISGLMIVWSTNLFNFMDGINGLAAVEAISVSLGAALVLFFADQMFHAVSLLVLTFSTLGFLFFNFPKARIFMGDVGSGFLGFLTAIYAIGVSSTDVISPWSWVILYGFFLVDSTVTLITRAVSKQNIFGAHNLHAYQKMSRRFGSHSRVTISILLLNVFWLFPLAFFATIDNENAFLYAAIALAPLLFFTLKVKAGVIEK